MFSVEDMLTYFHLDNQLNMELDQGCADFWIWLYSRHFKASVYVNIVYVRELICMCAFASELLLVHLWHTSAPVPGHLPPDWLHHGLENERVWGRHSFCKGRPTVRHFTVYYKVVDLSINKLHTAVTLCCLFLRCTSLYLHSLAILSDTPTF